MKIYFSILFAFVPMLYFAQQQDYNIYSSIINYQLNQTYDSRINKLKEIVIVEKIEESELDWDIVDEVSKDSVPDYMLSFIDTFVDKKLGKRFLSEIDIRRVIAGVDKDIKNQPNIDSSKIKLAFPDISICIFNNTDLIEYCKQKEFDFAPMSIFRFSKINYYGNFAAFYLGYTCGGLCGEGKMVVLEKVNGKWFVIGDMTIWMS